MRHFLWPLGVVVAFGLGLAMAGLSRDAQSTAPAADHPQAVGRRLEIPETIPVLEALLANAGEDRFVRMSAAYGLAQLGKLQGVIGLTQIFDESNLDGRGRDMAFRALRSLDDERSLPFMRQVVTSGDELSYRLQAIRFLEAHGDRQSLVALERIMQSPTEQASIRDAATRAHAAIARR